MERSTIEEGITVSTIEELIAVLQASRIFYPGVKVTDPGNYPLTVRYMEPIEGEEARVEVGR